MSLSQLFRKSKLASFKKINVALAAATAAAGVAGFVGFIKAVDSKGNVISSSSSSNAPANAPSSSSGAAVGFATNNPILRPATNNSAGGSASYNPEACVRNPTVENCDHATITQKDWDQFLPPEGIVVRDAHGNVVFKKCRSLTEGAANAKTEMDQEKARFDKFNTAMNLNTGKYYGGGDSGDLYNCRVKPNKVAPKEAPCPTLKNFTELKDYYRQQYYQMSNELQSRTANNSDCLSIRDKVMSAADPNWKSDRSLASDIKPKSPFFGNRGAH